MTSEPESNFSFPFEIHVAIIKPNNFSNQQFPQLQEGKNEIWQDDIFALLLKLKWNKGTLIKKKFQGHKCEQYTMTSVNK